jgi:hypothetical protein
LGLINKCKACFILQCKTSALLPTQTLNKKYPPFNVYCLHAWIEYRLKMEYTDLWSRCCLKVRALGYYCAFVICILCLLECIFRLQHAVECTLNPCLLCFFFLLARREILHSYGFEHMHLLYNLEKAGLLKRQVSQIWVSPNFFFRVICGFFNVVFFCLPSLQWHIVVLPRNQEAIGLVLQEHCSL